MPERLRAPIVLCYLQGLTYDTAAHRLGLSEVAIRGRLARARERLRRRLTRRGVTVPAGLLATGAAGQAQAAVPELLIHSTIRIALGFLAGNTAAVLARGVLNSMLLNQLKVVTALTLLTIGSGYWLWHAYGLGINDNGHGQDVSSQAVEKSAGLTPKPQLKAQASASRLTGTVRVEGTGQPVAGARLRISIGFVMFAGSQEEKVVETGADGQFAVDLPAGNTRVWLSDPPAGYLVLSAERAMEDLEVRADQPVAKREYSVRQGTIWNFQFLRGSDRRPFRGIVTTISRIMTPYVPSRAQADDRGRARLTLPTEGRKADLGIRESDPLTSSEIETGMLPLTLDWEPGFRPDELEEISRIEGNDRRFRLLDAHAKSAVLHAPELIEPVKEKGKLVLRVTVPYRDAKDFGALTGQVLDEYGSPVAGAHVGVWPPGAPREPDGLRHRATTDPQGRYRLRDIPRRAIDGKPLEVRLTVTKAGYAGVQFERLTLTDGDPEKPKVIDPIRLERGVSLRGLVVDHRGQPAAGAAVCSTQLPLQAVSSGTPQTTRTDENGRFLIDDLHRGVTSIYVFHGKVRKSGLYLADGSAEAIRIKLPERMEERGPNIGAFLAPPPEPLAVGQPAPEWQVGPWSDGRPRKLADERGKVVVLYFWGVGFWPSVSALPSMSKLATRFQPRGVEFLAIHNAEPDEDLARELGRKVLAFRGATLVMAIDQCRSPRHAGGVTVQRYGGQGFPLPVIIVIDRAGKIAFRSDTAIGDRNSAAVLMQIPPNNGNMSEQQISQLVERTLADEIEKALKQKD